MDYPPTLFRYSDYLVSVGLSGTIDRVKSIGLTNRLALVAHWRDENGRAINPPTAIAASILEQAETLADIPQLDRVVTVPVLDGNGRINTAPGYQADSRTYYMPVLPDLTMPDEVDADDVQWALSYLLDDLLLDFPFTTDADFAHALALMLQPFVRDLIRGPTPLYLVDAPKRGTGKSLLAKCLIVPAVGESKESPWAGDESEQRKNIGAVLLEGTGVVLFDNVRGTIKSQVLELVLTSTHYRDRLLGTNETIDAPVSQTWVMTANNLHIGGDLIRRVVKIRLDAHTDQPERRKGPHDGATWKHTLPGWAYDHRTQLVTACLALCMWWRQQGSPTPVIPADCTMGGYESWQEVMGGILHAAGVPGFLSNVPDLDASDDELGQTVATFAALLGLPDEFTAAEALAALPACWTQLGVTTAVGAGKWLGQHRDQVAEGMTLRQVSRNRQSNAWRIEK